MRWSSPSPRAGALSQEDLDAYHVIESTPRSVRVNDFTVHARGNDLDDLLGTMERVAPVVDGDPTTDATLGGSADRRLASTDQAG